MTRFLIAAALAVALAPQPARAQRNDLKDEVDIARLMDKLRTEMWEYRRGLDAFRRAPQYDRLLDLRYALRNQAIRVVQLEDRGRQARRAQREVAGKMKKTADELKRLTGQLEDQTDDADRKAVRRRGDRLKEHADRIEDMIDRLARLVKDD